MLHTLLTLVVSEMNTTKLLCKLFDDENKGYVTVLDIIKNILVFCMVGFCVLFLIYGIYLHYIVFIIQTAVALELPEFERICFAITGLIGILACFLSAIGLFLFTIDQCDKIKIVQCKK